MRSGLAENDNILRIEDNSWEFSHNEEAILSSQTIHTSYSEEVEKQSEAERMKKSLGNFEHAAQSPSNWKIEGLPQEKNHNHHKITRNLSKNIPGGECNSNEQNEQSTDWAQLKKTPISWEKPIERIAQNAWEEAVAGNPHIECNECSVSTVVINSLDQLEQGKPSSQSLIDFKTPNLSAKPPPWDRVFKTNILNTVSPILDTSTTQSHHHSSNATSSEMTIKTKNKPLKKANIGFDPNLLPSAISKVQISVPERGTRRSSSELAELLGGSSERLPQQLKQERGASLMEDYETKEPLPERPPILPSQLSSTNINENHQRNTPFSVIARSSGDSRRDSRPLKISSGHNAPRNNVHEGSSSRNRIHQLVASYKGNKKSELNHEKPRVRSPANQNKDQSKNQSPASQNKSRLDQQIQPFRDKSCSHGRIRTQQYQKCQPVRSLHGNWNKPQQTYSYCQLAQEDDGSEWC